MVKRKKRIAVAMSAGVDSSVAAAILQYGGFDIIGVTMSFDFLDGQAVENAQRVAKFLGIKHRVINFTDILKERVVDNFCQEYLEGRTPNPCLCCNQYVKFGALLKQILAWDYDFLATGHYVRGLKSKQGFLLKKGKDRNKDQSYFLYRLTQNRLKKLLFPLGGLRKPEVIKIAKQLNLPVAQSKESQEICFLAGRDYRGFLKQRIAAQLNPVRNKSSNGKGLSSGVKPGLIVNKSGNILGQHQGIPFYTIGQREGLNIALGYRAYVIKIDAAKNQVVLGSLRDSYGKEFVVTQPNFILRPIKKRVVCKVKIRYNHKEAEAEIIPQGRNLSVRFRQGQFAITPGQSAVFYDGNIVIGGGIIN